MYEHTMRLASSRSSVDVDRRGADVAAGPRQDLAVDGRAEGAVAQAQQRDSTSCSNSPRAAPEESLAYR